MVCRDVAAQIAAGNRNIVGVMLESNLVAGAQELVPGQPLINGQSITDGCIDWPETYVLLKELAEAARQRRSAALRCSSGSVRTRILPLKGRSGSWPVSAQSWR